MAKKSGEGQASDKLALKKAVEKKISYVLKKPRLNPREIYHLVKSFFQAYNDNEYEYTREELLQELDKIYLEESNKERVEEIILRLGELEFGQPQYSREELEVMLKDFRGIVSKMIHSDTIDLNIWDRLVKTLRHHGEKEEAEEKTSVDKFIEEADKDWEEVPEPDENVVEKDIQSQEQMHVVPNMNAEFEKMLREFHENIAKDNHVLAKLDYEEMKHAYENMSAEEQHSHYEALRKAYDTLENY